MVDRIYDDPALHRRGRPSSPPSITPPGWSNSLGQKLVQLTMPGVPDVYQGTELWDYSLVDPDNRRPVDFAARRELLARLDDGWRPPVDDDRRGQAAGHQPRRCGCAGSGRSCSPVLPAGASPRAGSAEHALAFDRGGAVTVATRLPVGLSRHGGWGDTTLSLDGHSWTEVFTNTSYGGNRLAGGRAAAHVPRRAAGEGVMTNFEVWAPEKTVKLRSGAGRRRPRDGTRRRRLVAAGRARRRPRHRLRVRPAATTTRRCPTRGRAWQPARRARPEPGLRPRRLRLDRRRRGPAGSCPAAVLYELHIGTFTPAGHLRRRDRAARPPGRARRRPGRAAAGQRLQRRIQLGLRRRLLVRAARGVRRAGRAEAVRRRGPRHGPRAWCSTSSTTTSARPARTRRCSRPYLRRAAPTPWGALDQPGRPALRRGPPLHHRQRADVAARLPRRRAAPGRRARAGRPRARSTCSSSSRSRSRRCRRTWAGRCR